MNHNRNVKTPRWSELASLHIRTSILAGAALNRSWLNCCDISHSMEVATAMGNFPEVRRLRAQLIARVW